MPRSCCHFLTALLALLSCQAVYAQTPQTPTGILNVNGRVKTSTKPLPLKGRRFYLFTGGLDANRALIDKLKTTPFVTRDCYYCGVHASPEFMNWLHGGDGNCDSPYCRVITAEERDKVPEFKIAYQKGVAKQFAKKPILAQRWLLTSLDRTFLTGFYDSRKSFLSGILEGITPVQSAITDSGTSVAALFVNIPLRSPTASEKFVFSNLVPIEVGKKSFTWVCEVDIGSKKLVKTQVLEAPEASKIVKNCEVIVRDLPACDGESCAQK
jgi:hypothetical protein